VLNILLVIRLLSIRMTCPAHFSLLIFMYLAHHIIYIIKNYISFFTDLYPAQLQKYS
jgi:hypothetical protein